MSYIKSALHPETSDPPSCFSDFQKVLPMTEGFIRGPNPDCQSCAFLKECLKSALNSNQGKKWQRVRLEELHEQEGGLIGFIKRWSRLKMLK